VAVLYLGVILPQGLCQRGLTGGARVPSPRPLGPRCVLRAFGGRAREGLRLFVGLHRNPGVTFGVSCMALEARWQSQVGARLAGPRGAGGCCTGAVQVLGRCMAVCWAWYVPQVLPCTHGRLLEQLLLWRCSKQPPLKQGGGVAVYAESRALAHWRAGGPRVARGVAGGMLHGFQAPDASQHRA
jgi:hypothetical protein